MTFIPSSHIERKFTNGDEYILSTTRKNYIGPYVILNSNRYFTGEDFTDNSIELFLNPRNNDIPIVPYDILSNFKNINLKSFSPINYFYSSPTTQNYNEGFYNRYIAKNKNIPVGGFTEINYRTFDDLVNQKGQHDYYQYDAFLVRWNLKEYRRNEDRLNILERTYPGIKRYLKDPSQFVR